MKRIIILLSILLMITGFTYDNGSIQIDDAPLVYVKANDKFQYIWTDGHLPYTMPLRLGDGRYDIRLYKQDDDGVYRYYQRKYINVEYEPTYLENTYDCYNFEDIELDLDPIIQQVKEYCDTQEGWVCEERAKYLAWILRKNGIKCKVVVGQVYTDKSIRHAWNEVYINGEWQTVDISLDNVVVKIKGWEE